MRIARQVFGHERGIDPRLPARSLTRTVFHPTLMGRGRRLDPARHRRGVRDRRAPPPTSTAAARPSSIPGRRVTEASLHEPAAAPGASGVARRALSPTTLRLYAGVVRLMVEATPRA